MTAPEDPRRIRAEDGLRRPVDRRTFIRWAGGSSLAGLGLLGAFGGIGTAGASGTRLLRTGAASTVGKLPKQLKVGVIVPTSGIGQFIGDITQRSLGAAKQHIQEEGLFKGTEVDYEIVNAPAERFADATNQAYSKLIADPDVVGILWCTPIGLKEARAQIRRDQIPVIAVFGDPYSDGFLYPKGPERSIFQLLLPDTMSFDALCRYAAKDRRYKNVGLIYDGTTLGAARAQFEAAAKKNRLQAAGIEEFQIFSGDYGAQLQRLKDARPQSLIVWGLADNTAGIVKGLRDLGADYVDTPTAKQGSEWRPQILGYPGGTGEKKWAELAGDAAKGGSLTAWYLGGLVGGPQFAIRDWLVAYDGKGASGGEESPANGWWALLQAVKEAGGTDRRKMVTALEQLRTRFAGLPFGFGPKQHLGMTRDDVVLITLERYTGPVATDPPYAIGREWKETFPLIQADYIGPAHLVRPTLAANRRSQPEYIQQILDEGWGTQCTKTPPDALGNGVELSNECKIH
jgi:ABC-type branched-subunit amino acid transport system substrate-binding protein